MTPKEVAEQISSLVNFGLDRMSGDAPPVSISCDEDIVTFEVETPNGDYEEFELRVREM